MKAALSTQVFPKQQIRMKVLSLVLLCAMLFSGCSAYWWVGDGRGDWTLDLYNGYAISKINSKEILFVHKENPTDSGGSIVLSHYFVTAYQLYEPYICLAGIRTQGLSISDEELNSSIVSYCLVDTTTGKVSRLYTSIDAFIQYCDSIGLQINNEWISPSDAVKSRKHCS